MFERFYFLSELSHVRNIRRRVRQFLLQIGDETADSFQAEFRVLCGLGGRLMIGWDRHTYRSFSRRYKSVRILIGIPG